jgi:hypothetical protein
MLPLSLRGGMGCWERHKIPYRGNALQPPVRPLMGTGATLVLLAGAVAAVAYVCLSEDKDRDKVALPLKQPVLSNPVPPSFKKESERILMAFIVAQSDSAFFRNMVYNYIRSDAYEPEEVSHFLAEFVRELHEPRASEEAKGTVSKWIYALKCRSKPEYQTLLKQLHKNGFLPNLFTDQKYRSSYETHRIMDELYSDYKELKLS